MEQPNLLKQSVITPDGVGKITSFNQNGLEVSFLPDKYNDKDKYEEFRIAQIFSQSRKPHYIYAGSKSSEGRYFYPYQNVDLSDTYIFELADIKVGDSYKNINESEPYIGSQIYGNSYEDNFVMELSVIAIDTDLKSIICVNKDDKIIRLDMLGFQYAIHKGFYIKNI